MLKALIFISIFPIFAFGQATLTVTPIEQTKAYCGAIAEYVKVIEINNKNFKFDTLFIGKHEEFPEIELPPVIQNKKIVLLEHKKGHKEPHNRKSFILINIIEEKMTKDNAAFLIIAFHKDYAPQHNCHVKVKYNTSKNEFEAEGKIRFEYPYSKSKD